jgi:hypothetical protein
MQKTGSYPEPSAAAEKDLLTMQIKHEVLFEFDQQCTLARTKTKAPV